ncbi:MAG: ABC transporter substrate-binding protein [Acidimicrobiales bacterium]
MRKFIFLLGLLVAFALVAASCGDDSSDSSDSDTTTTETGDEPDTDEPDTDESDTDTPEDTSVDGDVELTASARGITEDTIRIGLAMPDVSAFNNSGDQAARYQVVVDDINANGGVIGRQIELVIAEWDLLDTTGFDAACVELTEDNELFAVVTRTPAGFGAMTCYTELGDTLVVNGLDLLDVEIARSDNLLYSVLSDTFQAMIGGIDQLTDELADAKIAVTAAEEGGGGDRADQLTAHLESLGLDVVATTVSNVSYSDDPTAALTEYDRFAEVWNSEGVTHVVGVGNGVIGAAYALDNNGLGDTMTLITPIIGVRTLNSLGAVLENLDMIGVAVPDPGLVAEQGINGMPECIALIEEALDETVIFFPEEEELNALSSTFMACASFDFLTAALEAVGPNPTREDFVALTSGGFSFEMTSAGAASTDDGKAYMNDDSGLVYDWDGSAFTLRG